MTTEHLAPADAIDPEVGYHQWVSAYLWHIDQIPLLLETTGVLALPTIGVSRGGSQFDRPQVTGGGFYDSIPIRDGGATADSGELWGFLARYVGELCRRLPDGPALPARVSERPDEARRHAYTAIGWMADRVHSIVEFHDLSDMENELFALVRRLRGRYRSDHTARRARPRTCDVCGEQSVVVDWVDGPNGSPHPVQVGKCVTCGEIYEAVSPSSEATS